MFMLLNNGKHPFYIKGDNRKDFEKKIEVCKINFHNKVSPMAKHLILKLLEPNPSWRYTGAQAIKHPWITRNKEDEVPLTFNEILAKSNNKKILRDLFNICLFMNYFSKNEKRFNINKEYIENCNFYDEKFKKRLIKKKEKCLDVLSTDEGDDDSIDKISIGNDFLENKKENKNEISNINNAQNSIIVSPIKMKNKRINIAKSSKNMNYLHKKFSTDKKVNLNFKKFNIQNISSINRKLNIFYKNTNNQKNNNNNSNSNNTNDKNIIKNNNPNNSVQNFNVNIKYNKESNSNMQIKDSVLNNNHNNINNYYYFDKNAKNRLPHIASPWRRKELNLQEFSLNNIENYNIVPIVLPNIENIKKVKNLRFENIKKRFRKKSSDDKK